MKRLQLGDLEKALPEGCYSIVAKCTQVASKKLSLTNATDRRNVTITTTRKCECEVGQWYYCMIVVKGNGKERMKVQKAAAVTIRFDGEQKPDN
jgi:hypothetical protein